MASRASKFHLRHTFHLGVVKELMAFLRAIVYAAIQFRPTDEEINTMYGIVSSQLTKALSTLRRDILF